jgi:signal peptidase I
MQEKNKIKTLTLLAIALTILEFFLLHKYFFKNNAKLDKNQKNCEVISETKYIRGISMEPILRPEQEITALMGYYNCHPIERNDIVLANYSGNSDSLIKQIKIISGDKFHVEPNGEAWNIQVNGEIVNNSEGEAYVLDEKRAILLQDYEQQYQGVVPEDFYYILGNIPKGSVDSTQFGFIGKKDILAKVEIGP